MFWLFVALIAVAVVAVALVVVGNVSSRLAKEPPAVTLDLNVALGDIADMLSDETTAQLSFDDVRAVLSLHLDYLELKGVARDNDLDAPMAGPVFADEDEVLAWVIGKVSDNEDLEVSDDQVAEILDCQRSYLSNIGAIEALGEGGEPGAAAS